MAFREALFTICLLWKPKTKPSRGGEKPLSLEWEVMPGRCLGIYFSQMQEDPRNHLFSGKGCGALVRTKECAGTPMWTLFVYCGSGPKHWACVYMI